MRRLLRRSFYRSQGGLSDRLAEASDTGWQYRDGGFELPDRPGIGVEINEALLEPFIVKG